MTDQFRLLEEERREIYTKIPENLKEYSEDALPNSDLSLEDLVEALKKLLERKELEKPLNTKVIKDEISVKERVVSIKRILKEKKRVNFLDLFESKRKASRSLSAIKRNIIRST